ncbi:hypothetical protein C8R47DRAFT_1086493 [Mycena vitilis]|nr:hypothetical protein C8R47DRAFT_1086493 [Mycena vitilis]
MVSSMATIGMQLASSSMVPLLPPGAAPPGRTSKGATSLAPLDAPGQSRSNMFYGRSPTSQDTLHLTPLRVATPAEKARPTPPLMIVGAQTLTVRQTLKRDSNGLYNNRKVLKGFKNLVLTGLLGLFIPLLVVSLTFLGNAVKPFGDTVGFPLQVLVAFYPCSMLYHLLELLVGTMYLERDSWVFLEESEWFPTGRGQRPELGKQDSKLRKLAAWGSRQLVPKWEVPPSPNSTPSADRYSVSTMRGKLVDLSTGVCVEAVVTEPPEFIIPLAIHGSGVTCMLLKRPKNVSKNPAYIAKKVGMANFPTYVLAQMDKETNRTIIVSSEDEKARRR